jgi:hypothetical protein
VGERPSDAEQRLLELDEPTGSEPPLESGVTAVPHPTIVPEFNPAQYAEQSEFRERMPTLTDDSALEEARLQSIATCVPPPPRRPLSTVPGPLVPSTRDSFVEIDTGEADLETLDTGEQVAILSARLAPLTRVPSLAKEMAELGELLEDPKTAYVLGFVDGILPLETIVDVTGLPELETLRVLERMISQAVVVFRPAR